MSVGARASQSERGSVALEFALLLPVLLLFLIGTVQLGQLLFAHADLRNGVAAGARLAAIFPRPSDAAVIAAVNEQLAGLDRTRIIGPAVRHAQLANGAHYAEISMSYSAELEFIVFDLPPVQLSETRRVFTQPASQ